MIDLEATCWADDDPNGLPRVRGQPYPNEIIEIGAALVHGGTLETLDEYQAFVRPMLRPRLSVFCQSLTHIRQVDVDNARDYPEVLAELVERFGLGGQGEPLFASWGAYDRKQFESDCERYGIAYPFTRGHLNLKNETARYLETKPKGVGRMLNFLRLQFEGTQHRALEDVKNIVRIAQETQHRTGCRFV